MLFQGNEFHDNLAAGFFAQDFSHHFTLETNQSFKNGASGFMLVRGTNNFQVRTNKSFENGEHGFLLDQGSATITTPATPTTNNLLEQNEAYSNQGFGVRILGSNTNTVQNNRIYQNTAGGISVDRNSTGNLITNNQLTGNTGDGIILRGAANTNIVASNVISTNVGNGIYVRSSSNDIHNNQVTNNQAAGIAVWVEAGGFSTAEASSTNAVESNKVVSNTVTNNGASGVDLRGASKTEITTNLLEHNGAHGVYLTSGANQSKITKNILHDNIQYGIQMSGAEVYGNTWVENQIYANRAGGISFRDNVNGNITPPSGLTVDGCTVSGISRPGWTVQIFSDESSQGHFFQGQTVADSNGNFTFKIAGGWIGAQITAAATDPDGNSTVLSAAISAPANASCNALYLPLVRK
jgi:parallel beta-helix repeat protein